MKWPLIILVLLQTACVDVVSVDNRSDLGVTDSGGPDIGPDSQGDLEDLAADVSAPVDLVLPPFCDLTSSPVPVVRMDQQFVYPAVMGNTRDVTGPVWIHPWEIGLEGFSSNHIVVLGDEGRERIISGIWLPFGSNLHFRLADHYPHNNPPEIVPEYLAVSVLVDHKKVLADYEWEWKGRENQLQSFFMSVPHQTTQFLEVKIPASAFPEARTYDVVVFFFKPNAMVSQMIQMYRMTLYYGGFDVPQHPCIPIAEAPPVLTPEEKAYEQRTDWLDLRNRISLFRDHPAETTDKDSVLEVDKDATSVRLNVLFRGTLLENFVHEHVPMKIVTFIDYVAQDDSMLIGLPQDTRNFVHRDEVEIPLNSGPETIVWMVGIYNPWIPAVSWDNRVNDDIPRLYWAYRSNRIILRRKP